jgi:hypothetical protein
MPRKKKFGVREGARVSGDPQKIGEELETIRKLERELTAELVVSKARPKNSPLHNEFTWDDSDAAHKYRLVQARTLIRSVTVVTEAKEPVQHYCHVRHKGEKGKRQRRGEYKPMEIVVQSKTEYETALQELMEKLQASERAVQELQEAAGQIDVKDRLAIITTITKSLQIAREATKKLTA